MDSQVYTVLTTIHHPDDRIIDWMKVTGNKTIVVGDNKTTANWKHDSCDFIDLKSQKDSSFELANLLPENHYVRKNLGYLFAIKSGAKIIIDTDDALLVSSKENSQNIKNIVLGLEDQSRVEIDNHRKVLRPWGYYDSIDFDLGFQVKRICVNPGSKISLQKHKFRSEHWVVVKGTALITCGNKVFELKDNESTFIPKGEIHRLENKGTIPLEIIEVQTGDYLGEDDIIRLEDDYQRK